MALDSFEIEVTRTPTPEADALMVFVAAIVSDKATRQKLDDPDQRAQLIASAGLPATLAQRFMTETVTPDHVRDGIAYNTQSSDPFLTSVNFVKK